MDWTLFLTVYCAVVAAIWSYYSAAVAIAVTVLAVRGEIEWKTRGWLVLLAIPAAPIILHLDMDD